MDKEVSCRDCRSYNKYPGYQKGMWILCGYGGRCYVRNQEGNCKFYKRKWYKFWV